MKLDLPEAFRAQILAESARARPNECCGLIEGTREPASWRVTALHATNNTADDPRRRFLIDPQAHFRLLRAMRGTTREIIGCYHSHTDGEPALSATDRASATDENFVWIVAAGGALRAWVFAGGLFVPMGLRP